MLIFTLRRLGAAAVLMLLVLTATFFIIHIAPGDPFNLLADPRISAAQRAELAKFYGLDRPLPEQYWIWLSHVTQGDWGTSIIENQPAMKVLLERFPNTLLLVIGALVIEYSFGLGLGLLASSRPESSLDGGVRILSLILYSIPGFWLALLGIEFLAVRLPIFPTDQMTSVGAESWPPWRQALDVLHHMALPSLVLGLARFGGVMRFVRTGVLEVLNQDYIRTARAWGLRERRVLLRHALPNALAPLIHRFGVTLPVMLSGSVIIEVIFSWPGIGQAIFQAVLGRDYPVILASTAMTGSFVVLGTLFADLLHAWVDPRVRDA